MGGLERDELAEELVVLGVADLGRVLAVVQLVRSVDLGGERRVPGRRRLDVEGGRLGDEGGIDRGQRDGHRCEGTEQAGPAQHERRSPDATDPDGSRSGGEIRQVEDGSMDVRLDGRSDACPQAVAGSVGGTDEPEAAALLLADVGRRAAEGTERIVVDGTLDDLERADMVEHGEPQRSDKGEERLV